MYDYDEVLRKNIEYEGLFSNNAIMLLLSRKELKEEKNIDKLMDCIQPLSDAFQKCVLLRYSLSNNPEIRVTAKKHLDEELDHNSLLRNERTNDGAVWDPVLEATTSWFELKMLTLDEIEKHFLMHSILESSANVFFTRANEVISRVKPYSYFQIHSDCDDEHAKLGVGLYKHLTSFHFKSLLELQKQGWEIMMAACDRIAYLVTINF